MSPTDTAPPAPTTEDALQLLRDDHRLLRTMFGEFALLEAGAAGSTADHQGVLSRLAARLRAHATIEEEVFYPALEGRLDVQVLQRSAADHQALEDALRACAAARPGDARFDHAVAALAELLNAHVVDEERDLFPAAQGLDLAELGTRMALRLGELTAESGAD